jgi:RNA polymerase sigma-70 factor (ECF subfamily)
LRLFRQHTKQKSDEALMAEVISHHSHAAITALHDRYSRKLLGYFIRMLHHDVDKAQDFVQDIFLKILEKKHLYDPDKKFYTWLFTIAANMCKTEFRKPFSATISADEYELNAWAGLAEDLLEKQRFHALLDKSLQQLEVHHKTVFVLRYIELFSLQEIAEITETSLGTVKSRLFYATRKMTAQLKAYDPRYENNLFKLH